MPGSLRTAGRPDLGTSLSLGPRREQGRPRWGKGEHSQTPATPGVAAVAPTTPAPASRESSRPAPAPPPSASAPPPPASAPRPTPSSATLCTSHLPAQLCPALLAARRLRAPGRRTLLCHPRMPSPSAPSPGPLPPRPPLGPSRRALALSPRGARPTRRSVPSHLPQGSHQRGKVRAVRSVGGRDPALGRPGPCSFSRFAPKYCALAERVPARN